MTNALVRTEVQSSSSLRPKASSALTESVRAVIADMSDAADEPRTRILVEVAFHEWWPCRRHQFSLHAIRAGAFAAIAATTWLGSPDESITMSAMLGNRVAASRSTG